MIGVRSTAFLQAAQNGHEAIVRLLAQVTGASAKTHLGCGALAIVATGVERPKIMSFLTTLDDCDPRAADDRDGNTALMISARKNNAKTVSVLSPVSDLSQRNKKGQTALDVALAARAERCLDFLWDEKSPGRDRLAEVVAEAGQEKMPRANAFLERQALRDAMSPQACAPETSCGAATPEAPRWSARKL